MKCNCNASRPNCRNRCRRVAIRVTRIFDAARTERRIARTVPLSDFSPQPVSPPLTYVSSSFRGNATVSSTTVNPLAGSTKSRVTVGFSFPITVRYTDSDGREGTALSVIGDSVDLLLTIPSVEYIIDVDVVFASRIGDINGSELSLRGCLLIVVKVLTECDIAVPVCDFVYPEASLTDDLTCDALFGNLEDI